MIEIKEKNKVEVMFVIGTITMNMNKDQCMEFVSNLNKDGSTDKSFTYQKGTAFLMAPIAKVKINGEIYLDNSEDKLR